VRSLVFGGTGMLGRAVVAQARRRGWAALGLSRGHADVRDGDAVSRWVREFQPEAIFNCAAATAVDACEERREEAFAVNGEAVANVAAAAASRRARLVQVSTDYVFDGAGGEPYGEDAPTAPLSVYGASKRVGEVRALAYDRALVVRTSWLFGPGGPNFVATMLRLIAERRVPLRVVADQVGCPTYTRFLASALCDLVQRGAAGIVHYRNREPASWCELAREVAGAWDRSVEVQAIRTADFPRPAPRPAYSVLAVDRFEELVGRRVEHWGWGLSEYLTSLRTRGAIVNCTAET
jgi:dTDP-4-dehydrorhamnose reductase